MCSALKAHNSSSFSFISFCFEARWASDLDLIFSILQRPRDLAQYLNWEMSESALPLNMLNSLAFWILYRRQWTFVSQVTWRHSWQEHIQEEHWRRRRRRRLTRRRQPWCRPLGANSSGSSPWWWTWPAGWSPPRPPWLAPPCSPTRRRTRTPARSWSMGCRWSGCRTTTLELSQCWLKGSCKFLQKNVIKDQIPQNKNDQGHNFANKHHERQSFATIPEETIFQRLMQRGARKEGGALMEEQ